MNTLKIIAVYMCLMIGLSYAQCPDSGEAEMIRYAPGFKQDKHCGEYMKLDGELLLTYARQKLASGDAVLLEKGSTVRVIEWMSWDGETSVNGNREYVKVITEDGSTYYIAPRHLVKAGAAPAEQSKIASSPPATKIAFFTADPEIYNTFEDVRFIYKMQDLDERMIRRGMTGKYNTHSNSLLSRFKRSSIRDGLKNTIVEVIYHHEESDVARIIYLGKAVYTFGTYLSLQKTLKARIAGNHAFLMDNPEVFISINAHDDASLSDELSAAREARIKRSTLRKLKDNELVEIIDLSEGIAKVGLASGELGYCNASLLRVYEKDQ